MSLTENSDAYIHHMESMKENVVGKMGQLICSKIIHVVS